MRDIEYVYYSDIKEKKRNGRGTYNKKRQGGKSVRLHSDHVKRKDWEKMCGEVKSYNLGKPMTWKEFRDLPIDLATEYMRMLKEAFHLPLREASKLFGVATNTIYVYTQKHNIPPCWKVGGGPKTRARFYAPEVQAMYEKWMCGDLTLNAIVRGDNTETEPVEEEVKLPEEVNDVEDEVEEKPEHVVVCGTNIAPSVGGMTLDALVGMLRQMGCSAEISISIKI